VELTHLLYGDYAHYVLLGHDILMLSLSAAAKQFVFQLYRKHTYMHTYKLPIISMMHLSISHYLSLTTYLSLSISHYLSHYLSLTIYLSPLQIHVSRCTTARKVSQVQLFGLTAPLMTTSDGKKMGKTASGAVWLNKDLLSEYDYWQFWRNTADADVIRQATCFIVLYLFVVSE